ncbi:winged helix-turn-helix domain-containing protein [Vibrio rotiferianus]|uniref:winged helix-turn-helix domain-containing protein n=1 Tax=Vibrio rotiferianus TaxID=190895 RepID=UPI00406A3510
MTKLTLEAPTYRIGDILFSPTSGVIKKNNTLYKLRAKECSLLETLIEQFPEILSRNDIVERLYANTYATDATINQLVKRLRQSLDDDKRSLIRTIPKQGYQLAIAPINVKNDLSPSPSIAQIQPPNEEECLIPSIHSNKISLSSENTQKLNSNNERNLERFCGAVAVIGIFLSLISGYYYAEYSQQYSIEYLDLLNVKEYKASASKDNFPIALSENGQLKSIVIKKDENLLECKYDSGLKSTLCSLN